MTALISLLPRLGRRIAMMALILLFSVLTLVHGVLFHLTGKMFSFSDLNFAGDGARFFSWTYLNLRKAFLLCLVCSVLLMVLAAFLAPRGKPGVKWWKRFLPSLGGAVLSLANQFEAAGYTSNSFHSASPSIYSRGSVHLNLGFETYYYSILLGMDDYQLDSQMIRGYDKIAPEGSFFSYIITYSGHGPYTEEMSAISDPHLQEARKAVARSGVTGSPENMEEYTLAVAHAMETDAFVGELLEALKKDGKLENTALLFYADHYGKYMTDKEFLLQIKGVPDDEASLYRTPCFLYGGGLSPQKVEKYASSIDLVPTLVNLYDLPADRRYYVGDDIFGDKGGVIPLPNYAWYDGETLYSDRYQGKVTQEISDCTAAVKERMNASMDTLKCDYFKNWEQKAPAA